MRFLSIAALVGLASAATIPSANIATRDVCNPGEGRESNTSNKCKTCPADTFGLGGSMTCTPCPGGSSSTRGSSYCTCSPGYYKAGGTTTDGECAPCPAGQSSTSGASTCTSCPADTYSTSGGLCTACPSGTSSPSGSSQCTTLSCPAGRRPVGNACAICPAGTYSSAGDESCSDCPAGSISSPGSSSCTPCPGGSVPSPNANSCSMCPRNTYSNGKNCSPCPDGSTSNPGSSSCGPQPSKRAVQFTMDACPPIPGYQRCPVLSGAGGTECINVLTTLDSCGGCVGLDGDDESFTGQDCSAIPNVDRAKCEQGRCQVISCRAGYTPGEGTCTPVAKRPKVHRRGSI